MKEWIFSHEIWNLSMKLDVTYDGMLTYRISPTVFEIFLGGRGAQENSYDGNHLINSLSEVNVISPEVSRGIYSPE